MANKVIQLIRDIDLSVEPPAPDIGTCPTCAKPGYPALDVPAIAAGTYGPGTQFTVDEATYDTMLAAGEVVNATPPVISAVDPGTPGTTTATITWTTDLEADSTIYYRETGAPEFDKIGPQDTDPRVTSHSMDLTGLTADTEYDFYVRSQGAYGAGTSSAADTFTTAAS